MTSRILFNKESSRNYFFQVLKNKLETWTAIAQSIEVSRTYLDKLRNGEISLSETSFLKLVSLMPHHQRVFFLEHTFARSRNWGRLKGGKTTARKYPEILASGRHIAIARGKNSARNSILARLTPELGEVIGAFIGDGFTNTYGSCSIVQFTGDAHLDKDYFEKILIPHIKTFFPMGNPILRSKDNTLRLTYNSKSFHTLLTERFLFPSGAKSHTVTIPPEFLLPNNREALLHCVRGIFDTDGYISRDFRKQYRTPYLRIGLHMRSRELLLQIKTVLETEGIQANISRDGFLLQINGISSCQLFFTVIGFDNPRHFQKLEPFPISVT